MAHDVKEINFIHALDVAWILALWGWVHGGDPVAESREETTELIARALVSHLNQGRGTPPAQIVEKLRKLGVNLAIRHDGRRTPIDNSKQLHEYMTRQQGEDKPIPCLTIVDGHEICWDPIWWQVNHPVGIHR